MCYDVASWWLIIGVVCCGGVWCDVARCYCVRIVLTMLHCVLCVWCAFGMCVWLVWVAGCCDVVAVWCYYGGGVMS